MGYLIYFIPVLVVLFEYIALSSAVAYAINIMEYQQIPVSLLGGFLNVGTTIPYDAVPNLVVTLHLLSLVLGLSWLVYGLFYGWQGSDNSFQYTED